MTRVLAVHLPQFHPIPENDAWWGPGFTEWRNVTRGRPQFPTHYQPHLPADLGFYDLRAPEARAAQAKLASLHGIYGFCYYHYWFSGKLLLERPVQDILRSGTPDFPFCFCWANESWNRAWSGEPEGSLIRQTYSHEDDVAHVRWLLPYFRDPRYIKVRGRPVFVLYRAGLLPDPARTAAIWREEVRAAGFPDLYLVRFESNFPGEQSNPGELGFDASAEFQPRSLTARPVWWLRGPVRRRLNHGVYRYEELSRLALARPRPSFKRFPCVTPGWDNTARRATSAKIWIGSTPERYEEWLSRTLDRFEPFGPEEDFVFVNAWNEWAEGNHLEPDRRWGLRYLEATRRAAASHGATFSHVGA